MFKPWFAQSPTRPRLLSATNLLCEYKNDNTWRSFARHWLLLVEPGFCTDHYDRNHDKRRIY